VTIIASVKRQPGWDSCTIDIDGSKIRFHDCYACLRCLPPNFHFVSKIWRLHSLVVFLRETKMDQPFRAIYAKYPYDNSTTFLQRGSSSCCMRKFLSWPHPLRVLCLHCRCSFPYNQLVVNISIYIDCSYLISQNLCSKIFIFVWSTKVKVFEFESMATTILIKFYSDDLSHRDLVIRSGIEMEEEIKYVHPNSKTTRHSTILGLPLTIEALMFRGEVDLQTKVNRKSSWGKMKSIWANMKSLNVSLTTILNPIVDSNHWRAQPQSQRLTSLLWLVPPMTPMYNMVKLRCLSAPRNEESSTVLCHVWNISIWQ